MSSNRKFLRSLCRFLLVVTYIEIHENITLSTIWGYVSFQFFTIKYDCLTKFRGYGVIVIVEVLPIFLYYNLLTIKEYVHCTFLKDTASERVFIRSIPHKFGSIIGGRHKNVARELRYSTLPPRHSAACH